MLYVTQLSHAWLHFLLIWEQHLVVHLLMRFKQFQARAFTNMQLTSTFANLVAWTWLLGVWFCRSWWCLEALSGLFWSVSCCCVAAASSVSLSSGGPVALPQMSWQRTLPNVKKWNQLLASENLGGHVHCTTLLPNQFQCQTKGKQPLNLRWHDVLLTSIWKHFRGHSNW